MELVRTVAAPEGDAARARLVAVLGAVAAGDRRAFHELYQRTSAKLYGVCCRILGEGQDAEDALQEAYANVWRRADRFDASRASPITWLAAIARNAAIDRLRMRGTRSTAPIEDAYDIADTAPLADALVEQASDARRLHGCLGELGSGEAALIRTAFLEGASYPELAARAGEPLGTIKSRIRRALIKLRECLCR
ncbi:sigma-70 family RNA polymerase sigma factor [Sphingomonas sp.]|uniref:sigma-70 family RNA polymerase sigma factor n=1 Tax=Sphingomonas sp. TaxID=28214 RepID=UPI002DB9F65B|nr:sigma-70 family RNA polymerase sigma factor [Sphingomonas sp.]HEU4969781.1 sigma-70 family RNA polymerase sigma factor [Sphingomonas sp.]